ncbi:uncharacterized protein FSUBG_2426 [Fusarium subglutinans]|uniref:Uncharacterized protein n=1 Tax=Gibberella subglutinans TaxID=42677 RepID=A0A8H5Q8V6_GIBSU|nr:uncharacterized protein FSUBG_2426 [Fusarium subglutinans]KAF5611321.1 hypothetical protein FSUBG_2426 [Fusarium subglutinans]
MDGDSDLETDDEWEDIMPKVEKIEEHFAYARAATSLHHVRQHLTSQLESLLFKCLAIRRTVGSCDKHTMCLLRMRNLARYFSAYRYTQSLSPEGSNLFTVQEMATWFICASSIHSLQNTSCGVLGTNKKMNYNGPKDLKIRGLEILYRNRHLATRLCFIENGLVNTGFDYDPMAIDAVDGNPWSGHLVWPPWFRDMLRGSAQSGSKGATGSEKVGEGEFISLPGPSWLWTRDSLNYIELLGKKMEGKGKDLEAFFSILAGKTTPLRLHRRRKMPWDRR